LPKLVCQVIVFSIKNGRRGIKPPDESESTLKRTVMIAGFSLLWLSALEFIPGL